MLGKNIIKKWNLKKWEKSVGFVKFKMAKTRHIQNKMNTKQLIPTSKKISVLWKNYNQSLKLRKFSVITILTSLIIYNFIYNMPILLAKVNIRFAREQTLAHWAAFIVVLIIIILLFAFETKKIKEKEKDYITQLPVALEVIGVVSSEDLLQLISDIQHYSDQLSNVIKNGAIKMIVTTLGLTGSGYFLISSFKSTIIFLRKSAGPIFLLLLIVVDLLYLSWTTITVNPWSKNKLIVNNLIEVYLNYFEPMEHENHNNR